MAIISDVFNDTYRMIPLLFIMYLFISYVEHSTKHESVLLHRVKKAGPCIGALLGIIPQCGFSVLAASLYLQGTITMGTLISVFIATSDEMIPLFLAHPETYQSLMYLIMIKLVVAILVGYLVDFIFVKNKQKVQSTYEVKDTCGKNHSLFVHALNKTMRIYAFLFITTFILSVAIEMIGEQRLQSYLLGNSIGQPVLTSVFGFLPNCAASVILTQLYMQHSIRFASLLAGLISNAGLGFIVLLKQRGMRKQTLQIALIIFISAIVSGCILDFIM